MWHCRDNLTQSMTVDSKQSTYILLQIIWLTLSGSPATKNMYKILFSAFFSHVIYAFHLFICILWRWNYYLCYYTGFSVKKLKFITNNFVVVLSFIVLEKKEKFQVWKNSWVPYCCSLKSSWEMRKSAFWGTITWTKEYTY